MIGRTEEADARLSAGTRRFRGPEAGARLRRRRLFRGQPAVALARFAEVAERFPRYPAVVGQAEALLAMGRFAEAEAALEARRSEFGRDQGFMVCSAWSATRLSNWTVAFQRWADCLARDPHDRAIADGSGQAITLWRLATSGTDQSDVEAAMLPEIAARAGVARGTVTHIAGRGAPAVASPDTSVRDLMISFEGLGNLCEFGLVQRRFGAEPIGLLRWSNIDVEKLVALLTARLEGVGDPDNLHIKVQHGEYIVGDRGYFDTHTFISADHISPERCGPRWRSGCASWRASCWPIWTKAARSSSTRPSRSARPTKSWSV